MAYSFDNSDGQLVTQRLAQYDRDDQPRVGDYLVFPCGHTTRIAHTWYDCQPPDLQPADHRYGGTYYLGDGSVSHSGGLRLPVPLASLTRTDEVRPGRVWLFHHDIAGGGRGVETLISQRVYRVSVPLPTC